MLLSSGAAKVLRGDGASPVAMSSRGCTAPPYSSPRM